MAYGKKLREDSLLDYRAGIPPSEICASIREKHPNFNDSTFWRWVKNAPHTKTTDTIESIKKQIETLSARKPTDAVVHKIKKLSEAVERLSRVQSKEKSAIPKARPVVKKSGLYSELISRMCHADYGLHEYQKRFLRMESRFGVWLKARQIGATYVGAADALAEAACGMDCLILSASEDQAMKWRSEMEIHAAKLSLGLGENRKHYKVNGAGEVHILANNWRSMQGFSGNVYMDEFAWYQNPKMVWLAFVPSMGTKKDSEGNSAKLRIMSTPFDSPSLYYEIWDDETKYYMFERMRTTIHDAMNDGLDFDLETFRDLFDPDTFAMLYETIFGDGENTFFPTEFIKSCVDYEYSYYLPAELAYLSAGYDVGRTRNISALTAFEPQGDGVERLAILDILRKTPFEEQKAHIHRFLRTYRNAHIGIDKNGIGMDLAEHFENRYSDRAAGVTFSDWLKESMMMNMYRGMEQKKIILPNDPVLIADMHSIKKVAGSKRMLFKAKDTGAHHADITWSMALALLEKDYRGKNQIDDGDGGCIVI